MWPVSPSCLDTVDIVVFYVNNLAIVFLAFLLSKEFSTYPLHKKRLNLYCLYARSAP